MSDQLDYYALLDLDIGAIDVDIKKAYRSKALLYHPDKNPDNEEAAEMFQKIKKAYDCLSNESSRREYDLEIKSKHEMKKRKAAMSEKRKQRVDILEEREEAARKKRYEFRELEKMHKSEIERLREESLKHAVSLEKELFRRQSESTISPTTMKVSWQEGDYSEDQIKEIFNRFGKVNICKKKKNSAVLEMNISEHQLSVLRDTLKEFKVKVLNQQQSINDGNYEEETLKRMMQRFN